MISQTTEYAIRAVIELTKAPEGQYVLAKDLGKQLGIPPYYLAKILQQLARKRVLESSRGRTGGFRLAEDAGKIPLRQIVDPFEDIEKANSCILGQRYCNDEVACPLHDFWKAVRKRYFDELESKTVADLADFEVKRLDALRKGLERPIPVTPKAKSPKKAAARNRSSS